MSKITVLLPGESESLSNKSSVFAQAAALKRHLTAEEISILIQNDNRSSDPSWQNVYVSDEFDAESIHDSEFLGTVVLGRLRLAALKYHDLEIKTGIVHSYIDSCVIGDDVSIRNVRYLQNYVIGDRVILFNVMEMSCTSHSKFGSGVLKEGEPESDRIWIEIGNENAGRAVLPFETMLPSDAYLWSRYRDDSALMDAFIAMTERTSSKERNTVGYVGNDVVIKNTSLIKDVKIGCCAYIKGAFKLKNITVCSSEAEPSQIGEGVEMVNGIMGYGSKVFYQAVAVRFIIGRNCQLKYGVRLLNTILGDNSTVSCCELLNNLIYPFHEQHHNTSFLIASTIKGQSNIAAGATIGSNHNSRSPDGEIYAGRGFWPGLCSDFKHNSRFASFTLIAKGSYQTELNITYPFSLISLDSSGQQITIMPAYWFMHNMFAMARNNSKFKKRDKRVEKVQHIETDPLAPDTIQEVLCALERIIELTGRWLKSNDEWFKSSKSNMYQHAKDYLHQNQDSDIMLEDMQCMKRYGAKILKPARGYKEYRKIVKYFAVASLMDWCSVHGKDAVTVECLNSAKEMQLFTRWMNVGGQVIPETKILDLFSDIKAGNITTWDQVHSFYNECQKNYGEYKVRYAIYLLEQLYSRDIHTFTRDIFADILTDVTVVSTYMYESSISSRAKDYTDFFRTITYRNEAEMKAVVGTIEANDFLCQLKVDTADFNARLEKLFSKLH